MGQKRWIMSMMMGATGRSMGNRKTGGDVIPKGYKAGQLAQFTPEQMQLFQSLFSHTAPQGFLSKLAGGEEGAFNQLEAPALKQFAGLQGGLASRFSGMGSGARRSSGFQQASGQQASDFAQELQGQRMGLQRQALSDLLGISKELLGQSPYERFLVKKQPQTSFWQSLVGGALPVAGAAIGGAVAGMPGAKLGGTLGGAASKGFFGG